VVGRGTAESIQQAEASFYNKASISSVTPQANFPWKITFDTLYNNRFLIGICSRTLSIILRT